MENYDPIVSEIRNEVLKLNYDWFESKDLFLAQGFKVAKAKDIHFNKDVDLAAYCWKNEIESIISIEPTGYEIANSIVYIINNHIKRYTDVYAIHLIIQKVIEVIDEEAASLIRSGNTNYKTVLNFFVDNTRTLITQKFSHIQEQIDLTKAPVPFDRKLTREICAKIADFKINDMKLITSFEGAPDKGEALFYLLNSPFDLESAVKLRVEDWFNIDVYYLLSKLSVIFPDSINTPAEIEKKQALLLKTDKPFDRGPYDSFIFKCKKPFVYLDKSKRKSSIDELLKTIF